jgi:hypothetical protein
MPCPLYARFAQLSSAIFLFGLLSCAQAAELGDAVVRSHIGQPLAADIELTALADETAAVQVQLASPDVYRGANIEMAPVLASLSMSVMRRDGRQYLHITSIKAVDADHLNIFLELKDGGRRAVRAATLWLTADPHPAPAPPPPPPAPAPLSSQALEAATARAAMNAAPMAPPLRPVQARPAACKQQYSAEQIQTCAALDQKNAALTAQIVELEDKVRLLQLAIEARRAPSARPVAMPAPKAAVAPDQKARRSLPWLPIGIATAGLVAALLALAWFMRRKRKTDKGRTRLAAPAKSGFIASVKHRLMPGKKEAEAEAEPVEPTLPEQ